MKLNLKSLVDKKFEKFSRWEQREIYSYHDINEQDTNLELVTTPELKTKIRFDFKLAKLLHYKNTFLTISAIAGLVYFKFDLLGWALLVAWVVSNLLFLNLHENWVHGYIQAKNKFLDIILDSTTYFFYTKLPIIEKIDINNSYTDHLLHHKYWQTPNDPVDYTLKNNNLFTFIFGDPKYVSNNTNYKSIRKTNIEERLIDQHQQIIVIFLHLLLLVLLGFKYYFYFVVLQIWFANIYNRLFIEYIPHKLLKNKQDIPILIPFVGTSAALHNEHHIRNTHILDDHGLLRKYLNPHYYLTKLFFKLA